MICTNKTKSPPRWICVCILISITPQSVRRMRSGFFDAPRSRKKNVYTVNRIFHHTCALDALHKQPEPEPVHCATTMFALFYTIVCDAYLLYYIWTNVQSSRNVYRFSCWSHADIFPCTCTRSGIFSDFAVKSINYTFHLENTENCGISNEDC